MIKQLDLIVIYSDLVGSTRSVKDLNPKQVERFYSIFLNEMTNVINDFDGKILKYVGDCIIGFFILPSEGWIPIVDNVFLCVQMMQKIMIHSISPIAQSESLPAMSCRIGVDCGGVQVVKVGVEGIYTDIDVFGDVMNVTKKICDKAESGEILIGKNLWEMLYTSHKLQCKKTRHRLRDKKSYDLYSLHYQ